MSTNIITIPRSTPTCTPTEGGEDTVVNPLESPSESCDSKVDTDKVFAYVGTLSDEILRSVCLSGGGPFRSENVKCNLNNEDWELCYSENRSETIANIKEMFEEVKLLAQAPPPAKANLGSNEVANAKPGFHNVNEVLTYIGTLHYKTLQTVCRLGGGLFAPFNQQYGISEDSWESCYSTGRGCRALMIARIATMLEELKSLAGLAAADASPSWEVNDAKPGFHDIDEVLTYIGTLHYKTLQTVCTSCGGLFATINEKYGISENSWASCYSTGRGCRALMIAKIATMLEEVKLLAGVATSDAKTSLEVNDAKPGFHNVNEVLTYIGTLPYKTLQTVCSSGGGVFALINHQYGISEQRWRVCGSLGLDKTVANIKEMLGFSVDLYQAMTKLDDLGDVTLQGLCLSSGGEDFRSLNEKYGMGERDWWSCYDDSNFRHPEMIDNIRNMFDVRYVSFKEGCRHSSTQESENCSAGLQTDEVDVSLPLTDEGDSTLPLTDEGDSTLPLTGAKASELLGYLTLGGSLPPAMVNSLCMSHGRYDGVVSQFVVPDEEWKKCLHDDGVIVLRRLNRMVRAGIREGWIRVRREKEEEEW